MSRQPEAGTWQRVRTDAGWHARLVGANGEIVFTSEVYTDPDTAENALAVALRSLGDGTVMVDGEAMMIDLVDIDERASTETVE